MEGWMEGRFHVVFVSLANSFAVMLVITKIIIAGVGEWGGEEVGCFPEPTTHEIKRKNEILFQLGKKSMHTHTQIT